MEQVRYGIIGIGNMGTTHAEYLFAGEIKGAVLAASVAFIIVGIVNGGMSDVLGKAVRICTECIGLG